MGVELYTAPLSEAEVEANYQSSYNTYRFSLVAASYGADSDVLPLTQGSPFLFEYTVADEYGNRGTPLTRTVAVEDTVAPSIHISTCKSSCGTANDGACTDGGSGSGSPQTCVYGQDYTDCGSRCVDGACTTITTESSCV